MVSLPLRLWVCADPTITPNIHLPLASGPEYQCTLKQLLEDEVGVWQPQPSSGMNQIPTSLERILRVAILSEPRPDQILSQL